MIGFFEATYLKPLDHEILKLATSCVEDVDLDYPDHVIRCHELARAIQMIMACEFHDRATFQIVDGWHCRQSHTWIEYTLAGSDCKRILDPYRPGCVPKCQILCYAGYAVPWGWDYAQGPRRPDIDDEMVAQLTHQMKIPTTEEK